MNHKKYDRLRKETNICKIKHHKQIVEYEQFLNHKMFRINKLKNIYSKEVYDCLHKPRYPTFTTSTKI